MKMYYHESEQDVSLQVPIKSQARLDDNVQQRTMKKVKSFPRKLNDPFEALKKSSSCVALNENFNQSLISRIRGVSRRNNNELDIKKICADAPVCSSKLTKSKNNFQNIKEQVYKNKNYMKDAPVNHECQNLSKIISDLKATIKKQKIQNQQLLSQIQKYECQIFMYKQQIEQLKDELEDKNRSFEEINISMKQKQKQFCNEYSQLMSTYQSLELKYNELQEEFENKNQIIEQSYCKKTSQKFTISLMFEEKVISIPSLDKLAILKANAQIFALKKHISSFQKSFEQTIAEVRRQKDNELEQIRKKFATNLNHYKEIIIKFTTKSNDSKFKESLLESTFTQNSSNQQI